MPIDLSFSDLMKRATSLLEDKVEYMRPDKIFWSCNVLCPPNYMLGNGFVNLYLADPRHYPGAKYELECSHCLVIQAMLDAIRSLPPEPQANTFPHADPAWVQGFDVLLHMHDSDKPCFTNDFCHVLGYRPTGSEHPSFIRFFYEKWPTLR